MDEPRRRVVIAGIVGGAFALAGLADLVVSGKRRHRGLRPAAQVPPTAAGSPSTPTPSSRPASTPGGPSTPTNARVIASLAELQRQGAIAFDDAQGTPSVLVAGGNGGAVAFSRVCTHAGCLVQYDPLARVLICPCHGAEYDPAHGAAVIAGPAPAPLDPVAVRVADGSVVLDG